MSAIGQPDFQRGVTSAQIELATVAPGVTNVNVGIPPNAETLVVIVKPPTATQTVSASGVSSGVSYPTYKAIQAQGSGGFDTWFIDVSSALDTQALISIFPASGATWQVYADAGVHVTLDASKRVSAQGLQYVIPSISGPYASDHPPYELSVANNTFAASTTLIAAPGGGQRLRLFSLQMSCSAAGMLGLLANAGGGTTYLSVYGVGSEATTIPPQGFAMPPSTGLGYFLGAGAGNASMCVYYTTETP